MRPGEGRCGQVSVGVRPGESRYVQVSPVRPGENVLLAITHMTNQTTIELRQSHPGRDIDWIPVNPIGITLYGATVAVPPSFSYGEFEARAGGASSKIFVANMPSPWFLFGDAGDAATVGGHVRVARHRRVLEQHPGD